MFKNLLDILKNLRNSIGAVIKQTFKETEHTAIDMNVSQMYDFGVDRNNEMIGEYSDYTKSVKSAKGQKFDFVTLRDTGDFHDNMGFQQITEEYAEIDSSDIKTSEIKEEFGDEIMGLTEENKQEYSLHFEAEFIEQLKKRINEQN